MVAVGEAFPSSLTCVELADRAMISRLQTDIQIQSPSDTMQFSSRIDLIKSMFYIVVVP